MRRIIDFHLWPEWHIVKVFKTRKQTILVGTGKTLSVPMWTLQSYVIVIISGAITFSAEVLVQ